MDRRIIPILSGSDIARFWKYVDRRGDDECWDWQAAGDGYGVMRIAWHNYLAHRVSYLIHYGDAFDQSLDTLHRCDRGVCVAPHHLFLGTQLDNMQDMATKGRHFSKTRPDRVPRGDRSGVSKLTEAIVADVRRRYANGERSVELAVEYGVHQATIQRAISGSKWNIVPGAVPLVRTWPKHMRGEGIAKAKLTAAKVVEIRQRWEAGERSIDLALEFGVTDANIACIVHRQTWKHVP